jgi:ELWxxDGT repeat protein
MKSILCPLYISVFVAFSSANAQTPVQLTEINTATRSSNPVGLQEYNGSILFYSPLIFTQSNQLWKTDGTTAGTVQITNSIDISFYPGGLATTINGIHYFQNGNTLVRTDGTAAGTSNIKFFSGTFVEMWETGGKIFIGTRNYTAQTGELWVSDGTEAGTIKLKSFDEVAPFTGIAYNYIDRLIKKDGKIYFVTQTPLIGGCCGSKLWTSDGTVSGTVVIDPEWNFYYPFIFQNKVFYFHGSDLYSNTFDYLNEVQIKTIPAYGFLRTFQSVEANGYLYFTMADPASTQNVPREDLWRTNGTDAGTVKIYSTQSGTSITNLTAVGDVVYFAAGYNVVQGSSSGTTLIKDYTTDAAAVQIFPSNFTAVGTKLFYSAFTLLGGSEIWTTEGSGPQQVASPQSASARSLSPTNLIRLGNKVLFTGTGDLVGTELFSTEGTTVTVVKDIDTRPGGSAISQITALKDKVYFSATDYQGETELWRTNGSPDGESIVHDFTLVGTSTPKDVTKINGDTLFYTVHNGTTRDLYSNHSNTPVKNLGLGLDVSNRIFPNVIDKQMYFWYYDNSEGYEVYKSDVTNTQQLTHINLALGNKTFGEYVKYGVDVFIAVNNFATPAESGLYKIDGSGPGATQIKSIKNITKFIVSGNKLYFAADDGVNGEELWKSDGTAAGTVMVKDIVPGSAGSVPHFGLPNETTDAPAALDGKIYFLVNNGVGTYAWVSDGTEAGTVQLSSADGVSGLKTINGKVFFRTQFGLYVTDGTIAGTKKITAEYYPNQFLSFHNQLLYTADNNKLRMSDGSPEGTITLATLQLGYVSWTTNLGNTLYFANEDNVSGSELWKLALPDAPNIVGFGQTLDNKLVFTILGNGFSNAKAVYLGGIAAGSFTVVSDNQITATIQNVNAEGVVRVNTSGGTSAKEGFSFAAVPIFTSFSPAIGVTGSHIIIKGTNLTGVTAVSFGNKAAQNFTVNGAGTEIDAVVSAEGATGFVKITKGTETPSLPGFTFYGAPKITSFSPLTGLPEVEIIIAGENFYQVSGVSLADQVLSGFTVLGTDEVRVNVPTNGVTGKLKIVAASGTVISSQDFVVQKKQEEEEETPVGVEDVKNSTLEFYPSPVTRDVRIVYGNNFPQGALVKLYDSRGQHISAVDIVQDEQGCEAKMEHLPAGLYLFVLSSKENLKRVKVVKR